MFEALSGDWPWWYVCRGVLDSTCRLLFSWGRWMSGVFSVSVVLFRYAKSRDPIISFRCVGFPLATTPVPASAALATTRDCGACMTVGSCLGFKLLFWTTVLGIQFCWLPPNLTCWSTLCWG